MTKPKASKTVHGGKGSTLAQPPAPEAPKGKGWTLATPPDPAGRPPDEFMARTAAGGIVGNARTVVAFAHGTFGELSLTECAKVLKETAGGLNGGDLSAAVTMLSSQAVALDAMFAELARRSALNMGTYMDASERYLRLALKAQGQCRATLETLAAIKNPPVVFARQANINNGGQQQVNNGNSTPASASAHPGETAFQPNELLEDLAHGRTQLDTRATAAAGRTNQDLESVGAIDRPAQR
jgi:hypothetical protein